VSTPPSGALVSTRREEVGRRRVAPKAIETSDVTRHRGVLVAALLAGLAAVGIMLGSAALGLPLSASKPLSRPHRVAGLGCEACHKYGDDRVEIERACLDCHGEHPSVRVGHASLVAQGQLGCTTCHDSHRADAGVTFTSAGEVLRYDTDADATMTIEAPAYLGDADVSVPLISASACSSCHSVDNPRDPAAGCVLVEQHELGPRRPAVCFDEHQDVLTATAQGRAPAWEAAREVARVRPQVEPIRRAVGLGVPTLWVGSGLLFGLVFLGLHRRLRRLRIRTTKTTELPAHAVLPAKIRKLPQVNTNTCIGCSACVDACPYDVLEIHNYVAQVVRPDDCCGLTLCEQRCPNGSLIITDGEPIEDRPHMTDELESLDTPGVYLAGDLTGLPLIRNAINQGTHVVKTIARSIREHPGSGHIDLVIVGAGPAGLSAALAAKAEGLTYVILEQGSVAESIRSFPRGKLVFDQPLGLPLIGDLWLEKSSKEELLAKWMQVVHAQQLAVHEHSRVTAVQRVQAGPLQVDYVAADGSARAIAARRVLLAFGRRGSPRKLHVDIPDAFVDHVHYSVADARSFAGKRVLVIGLGDVAMEAAIAISNQPGAEVTISYRGEDFQRGKAKNMEEVRRLIAAGRIRMLFGTQVTKVEAQRVTLSTPTQPLVVECDSVFVMIGTIAPWEFLARCGVKRVDNAPTPDAPG
jgi:thioredoxin reductase/NAD-dependent dihydropyrimidine dehydrogenase PreA subunit